MFPLTIGRWSISYQGQKSLCRYHDVYQNMVLTLCSTSVPWKFPNICASGWGLQHKVHPHPADTLSLAQTVHGCLAAFGAVWGNSTVGARSSAGQATLHFGQVRAPIPEQPASTSQSQRNSKKPHAVVITGELCSVL